MQRAPSKFGTPRMFELISHPLWTERHDACFICFTNETICHLILGW